LALALALFMSFFFFFFCSFINHPPSQNPSGKQLSHIIHPVEMLHIHNLPPDTPREKIQALFEQYGTVVAVKIFEYVFLLFVFGMN
jgi:RNA recognition motif-containing protein